MRKYFLILTMVLLGLLAGVSTMRAVNISGMTDEEALTLGFWARMTAKPATTTLGSGLVFVSEDEHAVDPTDEDYASTYSAEGWSDIYLASSLISATVDFKVYAKANAGSYFTGWSFTDGYTDLGVGSGTYVAAKVNPSPKAGHANILNYTVYAAFEQVKLKSYELSGSNTMTSENPTCTQTVTFRAETPGVWALSSADDVRHFIRPVVTKKAGTNGTWTIGDAEWIASGAGQNARFYGEYAELIVPVTFTAPNGNIGEYGAELVLETYAGVKMKVYLSARTTGGDYEAIRYNKNKEQQETGALATLLTNAAADDIIKLNGNYSNAVSINKNITFDLNGYTLSNTLIVSDGVATITYSPYGGSANALNVTGGKAILNGGSFGSLTIGTGATVEQNGATITGAATNNGSLTTTDGKFQSGLTSSKTLVVNGGTFNGATAIQVTGGTASIKRGTIAGTQYGVLTTNGGSATIEKLAVVSGGTKALNNVGGSLTVNNGKFANPAKFANGDITFKSAYFKTNAASVASAYAKQQWRNTAGPEFREGYEFFVGDQDAAQASNISVCRIGRTSYATLEDALSYAKNHLSEEVIIIMENDYTLAAGYYTLPANATLIVPMSNDQEADNPIVPRETSGMPMPVSFRKLIFENGVNMEVAGTMELTCAQYGKDEQMGIPGGNYGHLIMKPGSRMTINNGGELRAWGFVTGDGTKDAEGNYLSGEIDARRGAIVREMFQMGDWKGGDISFTMAMEMPGAAYVWRDLTHLFPVYTYFIQNIESPVKYHPGSSLICATSVNVSGSINAFANDIKVVGKDGEAAMFLMDEMADAENTWVRKYYDAKKDQQVYEVNSGAKLGSVVIDLGEVPGTMFGAPTSLKLMLDSRSFVLPLASNFKIHLLTGYMEFTQSTSCLPGMEVEVDKESEVALVNNHTPGIAQGALYFYDADQWSFQNTQAKGYVGNSGKFGAIVRYSATWDMGTNGETKSPNVRDISSPAAIGDAKLIVHGTFRSGEDCSVYTSWSKDMSTMGLDENGTGGASIISTNEDAGTFIFDANAPAFDGIHFDGDGNITGMGNSVLVNYDHNDYGMDPQYPITIHTVLNKDERVYGFELCTPAKLKNADGTFAETEGTLAGTSYCYMDDKWTTMQVAPENGCFMKDNYGTFYAKPAEYVAVNATVEAGEVVGNTDHTFSDKDGAGRLFILMEDDCQWWEVEKKDNLYHCIHPNNDTYYFWNGSKWEEQRFTITWLNWDGTEIKSYTYDPVTGDPEEVEYSVTYGTQAEYLGNNPTREPNVDYTYDFTGWAPALGKVTSNVTYTATYKEQPRKYNIIFINEGGDEIERHLLTHNELPICENAPTRTGYTLQWEPALAAVTGDATYRATWLENPPTAYEIRFVDYDGYELQASDVNVGDLPAYEGADPTRKNTNVASHEFSYIFDHWSPTVTRVTQAMTYTAVYREVAKEYTVIFKNEDNSTIETRTYHYGEAPVCTNPPTKPNTAEWTYQLTWTPQIQAIVGNLDPETPIVYTADFETLKQKNKYSVTLKSNPSGAAVLTGAGLYDYNESATAVTIAVTNITDGYNFINWSDANTSTSRTMAITADVELVANFECPDCDKVNIVWKNWDDTELTTVSQAKGTATTYPGATPTKPATSAETYTFDGWATSLDGDRAYKNGMTPKAAEGGATYWAHFAATPIPNLTVESGVTTVLSAPAEYQNLILTSDGIHSGQLVGENYLTLTGEAYFDFAVNAKARLWYQVAVPWQVDARTGISADGRSLILGKDFDIIYYDGHERAANHVNKAWSYIEDGDKMMYPGQLYMMTVIRDASVIRFTKKDGADLLSTHTSVSRYDSDEEGDKGWNGVSNPALFHAYVNAGVSLGQVYIPGEDRYKPISMSSTKMVVGQGAYVQVTADKSIDVTYGGGYAASARRRVKAETADNAQFEVRIAPINKEVADLVFVETDDSKTPDAYTVGKDLAKMGVSTQVAQMWVDRYDKQLCMNTVAPVEGQATYPLGIFAPEDGEYSISILRTGVEQPSDLYLTLDGEIIWNLSKNAYTMQLEQGTTSRYGLRTVAKAPQTTTGIEETWVDNEGNVIKAAKVLIDNHVYIIRDGKMYTITGQSVKIQ